MKWEYRIIKLVTGGFIGGNLDERGLANSMNELGEEGWELVSAFDTSQAGGQTRNIIAVFKRQK